MNIIYQDTDGIRHQLEITAEDHLVGMVYTVRRNGAFFCELVKGNDDVWREVLDGPTTRAAEYGAVIDKNEIL